MGGPSSTEQREGGGGSSREDMSQRLRKVLQHARHGPEVHKVEVAAVGSFVLAVIDDESQIGWHPSRLDGREVGDDDLGAWELLHGPS